MWTKSKSLMLSIFCTRLFFVLLVAGVIFAPQIVVWYFGNSPAAQSIHLAFRITIYCCAVPGFFSCCVCTGYCATFAGSVYLKKENVTLLRVISWLCIAVGVVTLVSGLYYTSFFLVAAAAAFCGLIVRWSKMYLNRPLQSRQKAIIRSDTFER